MGFPRHDGSAAPGSSLLETHDPNWSEKWDRIFVRVDELNRKMRHAFLSPEEAREYANLSGALRLTFDARHKTANEYIRFQLSLTLKEADDRGIWAWLPVLPNEADVDAARAAVGKVYDYVEAVKKRRELIEACRRADIEPQIMPELPELTWQTRWAMLRWRLRRPARLRARHAKKLAAQ